MNINTVSLSGHLAKDPKSAEKVTFITLAVNESWTDNQGNAQSKVHYIECVAFNGIGSNIAKFKKKGDYIAIQGKLEQNVFEKDGTKVYQQRVRILSSDFGVKKEETASTPAANEEIGF